MYVAGTRVIAEGMGQKTNNDKSKNEDYQLKAGIQNAGILRHWRSLLLPWYNCIFRSRYGLDGDIRFFIVGSRDGEHDGNGKAGAEKQ